MGVAALVLGIIGALIALIPVLGMYAIPLTALALIFGLFGMRKPKRGLAIAGTVLGLVGTGMCVWQYTLAKKIDHELSDKDSQFNRSLDKAAADLKADLKSH
jgi:hypothetical protein